MTSIQKVAPADQSDTPPHRNYPLKPQNKGTVPKTEKSVVDRLKLSGLDPQKLLALALPNNTRKVTKKLRHKLILLGFFLFVAIPSALFSGYMFFWASDQFHSTTAFSVRSSNSGAAQEILGMVFSSGTESTSANSYILTDYLQSQAALGDLDKKLNLEPIFNREGADWLFRLGEGVSVEDKLKYWNSMVDISYDTTSGVILVEVRSFAAQDSVKIASAIVEISDRLVNQLSESNRRQLVQSSEINVAKAEARLKAIRMQLQAYRDRTQEISPEDNARLASEMIAGLDQEIATKRAEKSALESYLEPSSPRIKVLNQEIIALEQQMAAARKRVGSGLATEAETASTSSNNSLSDRITNYSALALEEEFAQKLYLTSLASLEQARKEADQKHMYLATFINPTLSESAQYPHRFLYSLSGFLLLSGLWCVCVLMYYNIRDRT